MLSLSTFFRDENQQRKALYAAKEGGWLDPSGNAGLYNLSRRAFDPEAKPDDSYLCFEKIYAELKSVWNVFRPDVGTAWPPERIFKTVRSEFAEFSWGSPFNLRNVPAEALLKPHLIAMRSLKPNKGYPSMAVSKFLHFYNPTLFPIYDYEVIWQKVCNGHFKKDYREYGDLVERREWNYGEDDETFLPFYLRWASSLLSVAHPAFMQVFADWFNERTTACEKVFDASELYATAFEFTAIGAAAVEERSSQRG